MSRRDAMAGATACAALGTRAGPAGAGGSDRPVRATASPRVNGRRREPDTRTRLLDAA